MIPTLLLLIVAIGVALILFGGALCLRKIGWVLPSLIVFITMFFWVIQVMLFFRYDHQLYIGGIGLVGMILFLIMFVMIMPVTSYARPSQVGFGLFVVTVLTIVNHAIISMFVPTHAFIYIRIASALGTMVFFHILVFSVSTWSRVNVSDIGAASGISFLFYPIVIALYVAPMFCHTQDHMMLLLSLLLVLVAVLFVWIYRTAVYWCCEKYHPLRCCSMCHRHSRTPKGSHYHHKHCRHFKK